MNLKSDKKDNFGLAIVLLMAALVLTIALFVTGVTTPLVSAAVLLLISLTMSGCVVKRLWGRRERRQ